LAGRGHHRPRRCSPHGHARLTHFSRSGDNTLDLALAILTNLSQDVINVGGTLTLAGPVHTASRVFWATGGGTTVVSGAVSGGGLCWTGSGTLTLSGANTYTGPTMIGNGTLALGADNTLPATTSVTVGDSTLDIGSFSDTVAGVTLNFLGRILGTTGV